MDSLKKFFRDEGWREDLDPEVRRKMDKLLRRVESEKAAYKSSNFEATAQIWVALGEIYSRLDRLDRRLKKVEKGLGKEESSFKDMDDKELKKSLEKY